MKIIGTDFIVFFDVDETLVKWPKKYNKPGKNKVKINHPYDSTIIYLKPHKRHINLLQAYKKQGYTIIIWSAQGRLYAAEVAKVLKLNKVIDFAMSKPSKYVDDLKAKNIMGIRVYIKQGEKE